MSEPKTRLKPVVDYLPLRAGVCCASCRHLLPRTFGEGLLCDRPGGPQFRPVWDAGMWTHVCGRYDRRLGS